MSSVHIRRAAGRLAATVLASTGAIALAGSPALAAGPYIGSNSGGANVRTCANTGCASVAYLGNGRAVTMVCWIDSQWVSPPQSDYGSARWFRISSPAGGYVHSSLVESQVSTPRC
ncbi:hypothetical protein AB0P21_18455 [Kribbella sp. NPDC056861]|uniref:SH3 domain-containing protein n=1 Tax=Kribbella sp. NPDC056861 TaxID=3154857 RepID=UPI003422E7F1